MCNVSYAVVTCEIKLFQNYFSLRRISVWNNFLSAPGNLPEIVSKLSRRLIAAREYYPACSMSLKWFRNNFGTVSAAEIILKLFSVLFHMHRATTVGDSMWNKTLKCFQNYFKIIYFTVLVKVSYLFVAHLWSFMVYDDLFGQVCRIWSPGWQWTLRNVTIRHHCAFKG